MSDVVTIGRGAAGRTVVFIHGLEGDRQKTWRSPGVDWPQHLAQKNPWTVVSVGYVATIAGWRPDMSITQRAVQLLEALKVHEDVCQGSIALVTHSLGGLVAKQMVRHAFENRAHHGWFLEKLVGIVFIATPHTGASLASFLDALGTVLGVGQATKDLARNAAGLMDLNQWYRNHCDELRTRMLVFYETQPVRLGPLRTVLVVDSSSSDPGIKDLNPIPLDEDHLTAAKPRDANSLQLVRTQRFLEEAFELRPELAKLRRQAAAVCYRFTQSREPEFLLVLTDGGRWTFPKGNVKVKRGESLDAAAAREAEEESGARGKTDKEALATYLHRKKLKENKSDEDEDAVEEIAVTAFLLEVQTPGEPREKNRNPTWFGATEARSALAKDRPSRYAAELERVLDEACRVLAGRR
jgi:8-oxo-dGTP pyrophosphatase MutT (NUDIX family)